MLVLALGVIGLREWKGPRLASRGIRVIKTVSSQGKGALVVKQSAREALMAKRQLRVRVNKIGPRASGLGSHVMGKCALTRKLSVPVGKSFVCVACGREGPHVLLECPE
jgi:hypothetical protein